MGTMFWLWSTLLHWVALGGWLVVALLTFALSLLTLFTAIGAGQRFIFRYAEEVAASKDEPSVSPIAFELTQLLQTMSPSSRLGFLATVQPLQAQAAALMQAHKGSESSSRPLQLAAGDALFGGEGVGREEGSVSGRAARVPTRNAGRHATLPPSEQRGNELGAPSMECEQTAALPTAVKATTGSQHGAATSRSKLCRQWALPCLLLSAALAAASLNYTAGHVNSLIPRAAIAASSTVSALTTWAAHARLHLPGEPAVDSVQSLQPSLPLSPSVCVTPTASCVQGASQGEVSSQELTSTLQHEAADVFIDTDATALDGSGSAESEPGLWMPAVIRQRVNVAKDWMQAAGISWWEATIFVLTLSAAVVRVCWSAHCALCCQRKVVPARTATHQVQRRSGAGAAPGSGALPIPLPLSASSKDGKRGDHGGEAPSPAAAVQFSRLGSCMSADEVVHDMNECVRLYLTAVARHDTANFLQLTSKDVPLLTSPPSMPAPLASVVATSGHTVMQAAPTAVSALSAFAPSLPQAAMTTWQASLLSSDKPTPHIQAPTLAAVSASDGDSLASDTLSGTASLATVHYTAELQRARAAAAEHRRQAKLQARRALLADIAASAGVDMSSGLLQSVATSLHMPPTSLHSNQQ